MSCFIAGGAFLYEYKTSFNEALPTTTICVIVYWIIQAIAFGYSYLIEKDDIFVGNIKENGKVQYNGIFKHCEYVSANKQKLGDRNIKNLWKIG